MSSIDIYSAIPTSQSKTEKFINKAILVHGELYNYDSVEYIHSHHKVKIECEIHGIFEQQAYSHLAGKGCRECSIISKARTISSNTEEFIIKAKPVHGELYNYELVEYINTMTKVKIICKEHGMFEQTPNMHLHGQGCSKCTNNISKMSTKWLNSLNITDIIFEYSLSQNKRKQVDGYSPSTNTVYQFHGDYWHGNPLKYNREDINKISKKTYGELYKKTIESDLWILSLGYNLVTMWESDFK